MVGSDVVSIELVVRLDMDCRDDLRAEPVMQFVFDVVGDVMTLSDTEVGVNRDGGNNPELMPVPADEHVIDAFDSLHTRNGRCCGINDVWLDPIEESAGYASSRHPEQPQDRYRHH